MTGYKSLVYPIVFALVLVPVFIVALLTFNPGGANTCADVALPIAHTHGSALASTVQDDMQLIFNVGPASALYDVVNGELEVCGGDASSAEMKHITVDVNDARLALGERLPAEVDITIRHQDSGAVVVQAGAPAMYSPGHGYHFGDNFLVPNGAVYDYEVTVRPILALRQEGAQALWREPVVWSGSFELDDSGSVVGKATNLEKIGEFTAAGIHVTLSAEEPRALYTVNETGDLTLQEAPPGSRYYVVDVTDHTVNYEEKLPGAEVIVTFRTQGTTHEVSFPPVISPVYGFHYGANVALEPGSWQITVRVGSLSFWRHAGSATELGRQPLVGTFRLAVE